MSAWTGRRTRVAGGLVAVIALSLAVVGLEAWVAEGDPGPTAQRPTDGTTKATATQGTTTTAPPSTELLPNLRSLPATDVQLVRDGQRRTLRFASTLANVGVGPMELVPQERVPCPRGQRGAAQAVYHDGDGDGRFARRADRRTELVATGCMLFHPTHGHWHFDASARYELTAASNGETVGVQDKVSFCLRDSERLRTGEVPTQRRAYRQCERDRRQGITVGWTDVYDPSLPGQSFRLPRAAPDGVYCLRLEADPDGLLRESDETDNGSVRAIRITGARVAATAPAACA